MSQLYRMPASRYNEIVRIEDQAKPEISQLLGIGKILVDHKLNEQYGVHLLHRHYDIDDGTIIFNYSEGGKQFSKMTNVSDLDDNKLSPDCFLFDGNDNGFVPFEYGYGNTKDAIKLPMSLQKELAAYFTANHLAHLLAIERLNPDAVAKYWCEHPAGETATYRVPVDKSLVEGSTGGCNTPTAWLFHESKDAAVGVELTCTASWRASGAIMDSMTE